jgi:hypothetical protein
MRLFFSLRGVSFALHFRIFFERFPPKTFVHIFFSRRFERRLPALVAAARY